jgi:hypothetical protein
MRLSFARFDQRGDICSCELAAAKGGNCSSRQSWILARIESGWLSSLIAPLATSAQLSGMDRHFSSVSEAATPVDLFHGCDKSAPQNSCIGSQMRFLEFIAWFHRLSPRQFVAGRFRA